MYILEDTCLSPVADQGIFTGVTLWEGDEKQKVLGGWGGIS